MMNMIFYDDHGESIEFDDEFSLKSNSDAGSDVEQTSNVAT